MIVINNRTDRPWRIFQIWRGVTEKNIKSNWVYGDIELADMKMKPSTIWFSIRQCALPFEDLFKVIEAYNPDTEQFYKEV
jgi:hypothetical protein|nr:MAG TPA: hypothetical protein [Caudoviricetes sp.]